jgi:hypothetical protein
MEVKPVTGGGEQVPFRRSWKFNFETGEFVLTPTGKFVETNDDEAWLEWCRKAIHTVRYRYLIYSRYFGQDFEDLIGRYLTWEARESELKRMSIECLMADPRTAKVENFTFQWNSDSVIFSCEISNVRGISGTVYGSVVNS